jgi:hypothetical protein
VKKGRHRRFEEARALKRLSDAEVLSTDPCPECGIVPPRPHAAWCMWEPDNDDENPDDWGPMAGESVASRRDSSSPDPFGD